MPKTPASPAKTNEDGSGTACALARIYVSFGPSAGGVGQAQPGIGTYGGTGSKRNRKSPKYVPPADCCCAPFHPRTQTFGNTRAGAEDNSSPPEVETGMVNAADVASIPIASETDAVGLVLVMVTPNVLSGSVAVHVHDVMSAAEIDPSVPSVVMDPESVQPD
jgi:hypothetical protein